MSRRALLTGVGAAAATAQAWLAARGPGAWLDTATPWSWGWWPAAGTLALGVALLALAARLRRRAGSPRLFVVATELAAWGALAQGAGFTAADAVGRVGLVSDPLSTVTHYRLPVPVGNPADVLLAAAAVVLFAALAWSPPASRAWRVAGAVVLVAAALVGLSSVVIAARESEEGAYGMRYSSWPARCAATVRDPGRDLLAAPTDWIDAVPLDEPQGDWWFVTALPPATDVTVEVSRGAFATPAGTARTIRAQAVPLASGRTAVLLPPLVGSAVGCMRVTASWRGREQFAVSAAVVPAAVAGNV